MDLPKVSEFMTNQLTTFSPDQALEEIAATLLSKKITGGPVLDEKGNLVGIISQKDCLRAAIPAIYEGSPCGIVRDHMTTEIESVGPNMNIMDVATLFAKTPFHRFPVLDDQGKLIGLVTRTDACRKLQELKTNKAHK